MVRARDPQATRLAAEPTGRRMTAPTLGASNPTIRPMQNGAMHGADSGFQDSETDDDQPLLIQAIRSKLNNNRSFPALDVSDSENYASLKQCLMRFNLGQFADNFARHGILTNDRIMQVTAR